jgi:signal transduction histidine kinase
MRVRSKFLLVTGACAVLFLGMVAVWRNNEQQAASTLLKGLSESQNRLVSSALEASYSLPVAFSLSFTYWDDMVQFVEKPTKQWGQENLDPSLSQYASDACLTVNLDGKVIYGVSTPGKESILAADLGIAEMMPVLLKKKTIHFLHNDKGKLYDVSAATIHKTIDAKRTGKVYGFLLIVNAVDQGFIKRLEKSTSMAVREVPTSSVPDRAGYLTLTKPLAGLDGKDVGYLSFSVPSESFRLLKESSNRSLAVVALFAITIVVILFVAIVGWINRPLNKLDQALAESSSDPLRGLTLNKNEFGDLARQVALSFEHKRQLESLLVEKTAAEEALKVANENLELRVRERTKDLEEATASLSVENAERRLAEVRMTEARNAAEEANQTKSRFLANMSHEFRTPLNSVLGFADLLKTKLGDDPKLGKYTENILQSGHRLENLLENMLTLADGDCSEEGGGLCDVGDVLAVVSEATDQAAKVKGIHLEVSSPTDLPLAVATKDNLIQVLFALAGNAVKYCQPDGAVGLYASTSPDGDRVLVEVRDNGIGLSADFKNVIFDRFSQAEDSKERSHQGAGIGLAVAKQLIERMGGNIWVESEGESMGCQFWISIPAFRTQHNRSTSSAA